MTFAYDNPCRDIVAPNVSTVIGAQRIHTSKIGNDCRRPWWESRYRNDVESVRTTRTLSEDRGVYVWRRFCYRAAQTWPLVNGKSQGCNRFCSGVLNYEPNSNLSPITKLDIAGGRYPVRTRIHTTERHVLPDLTQ